MTNHLNYIFFSLFIFLTFQAFSQNTNQVQKKFTISGYVRNTENGENLIGTRVYVKELSKGTLTNTYGFFSLTLPEGNYSLTVSNIGYKDYQRKIQLTKNISSNIDLDENIFITKTVEITAEKDNKNVESTEMGRFEMPIERIKQIPMLMGESDILKVLQLTPGVMAAGEGNSAFYVRGGGPDQNLILLDEAVVYNASHLFGFFSVFNSDALKDMELIKCGMPAEYGGRLASVLDITMKDGNNKKYHAEGGVGLIASRLTIEGPIKKDTSSFIISARRTYIDILMQPFIKKNSSFRGTHYYFYDLNAKINYILSRKDRLYFSSYFGKDVFTLNRNNSLSNDTWWGNATACLRWNHLFNDKLFANTSLIYSNYQFNLGMSLDQFDFKMFSGISDWTLKSDFTYSPNVSHKIKYGINYIFHTFTPMHVSAQSGNVDFNTGKKIDMYAHEIAAYIGDDFDVNKKIKVYAGLRYSYFMFVGPFDRYIMDNTTNLVTDTIHYGAGKDIKSYNHLEPRFSARYSINDVSSIKFSYTHNYQYVHMASVSGMSLPTDVWIPCSDIVKPQDGTQYSLGYYRNFNKNMFESYIEFYYKSLKNLIEYKESASPQNDVGNNTDNSLTFGDGKSYGAELFFKKRYGKLTGWVGYTLSWSTRTFPELNNGKTFFSKYDRRHDISFIVTYDFSEKLTGSLVWVYATGNTMTPPIGRYFINGQVITEWGDRNSYRLPPYHRMDVSLTYTPKKKRRFESSWNFSIYNVYNRYNPYFISIETTGDPTKGMETKATQISLFPILPSIAWNFKF